MKKKCYVLMVQPRFESPVLFGLNIHTIKKIGGMK
jgi:hypothetical protein